MSEIQPNITPTWAWLKQDKIALLAFGFGSGLAKKAPGTWGSLVGMLLAGLLLGCGVGKLGLFAAALLAFAAGIWICNHTGRVLGVHDYGGIVWDEIVAMLFIYALIPQGFLWWLCGFAVFRFFDIVKPFPISWVDGKVKGGLGVMLDDLLAAVDTVVLLIILSFFF